MATDPRKATALCATASGLGPLRARRQRTITDFADLLLTTRELSAAMRGGAARTEFQVQALFLMGGTAEVIAAVLSGPLRMSRRRVVDELTDVHVGRDRAGSTQCVDALEQTVDVVRGGVGREARPHGAGLSEAEVA